MSRTLTIIGGKGGHWRQGDSKSRAPEADGAKGEMEKGGSPGEREHKF